MFHLQSILWNLLNNIVKGNVFAIVQSFEFVAHVLEKQTILLRIGLQSTLQQPQDKLHLKFANISICFLRNAISFRRYNEDINSR